MIINKKKVLLFTLFLIVGFLNHAQAQKKWIEVEVEIEIPRNRSEDEVKTELLTTARLKAIEDYTGIFITGGEFSSIVSDMINGQEYLFDSFRTFSNQVVNGKIIDEKEPYYYRDNNTLHLKYEALIVKEKSKIDPTFEIDCSSNRKGYIYKEDIKFKAKSSKDAYLTIFSVRDDSISVIFPNDYWNEGSHLSAFIDRIVPNEQEEKIGSFYAVPDVNGSDYSELLIFVATLDSIQFGLPRKEVQIYNKSWMDLNKWLLKIPRNRRAQCYLQIQITNNVIIND
jgi:hypothetical protein